MKKIHWYALDFNHKCGLPGTILEICASADGELALRGLCVTCGEEFSSSRTIASIMEHCAVEDYKKSLSATVTLDAVVSEGRTH